MADGVLSEPGRVRTTEVIAALSIATDLAVGFPLEHGLQSTLAAMQLCERLGVDSETARQTYFLCLLFYVGCTAPVDVGWEVFGEDDSFHTYATPARFGAFPEVLRGITRAIAPPTNPAYLRAWRVVRHLPGLALKFPDVAAATCEVARMLTEELGLPRTDAHLVAYESERWDGWGFPNRVAGEAIPLPVRIVHVARDAAFQSTLMETASVAKVIRERAGGALDPAIAEALVADADDILKLEANESLWDVTLKAEPQPWLMLEGEEIDRALAAMGHFSDIAVPDLVGHSSGVAELSRAAAELTFTNPSDRVKISRAGLVHDLGRVAVPVRIWEKAAGFTADDWERVRLHAYHTERILLRSPFLSELAPIASFHHERLDGTGYHRGAGVTTLDPLAGILAAADTYHAMTEPRPHRPALSADDAARVLSYEAEVGKLGSDAVAAVLEAAGHRKPSVKRPAGLTEREVEVVSLLARGLQTKQIGRELQISVKTADHHIQNAYRKMEVSTRAGATLFAMQHGFTT